MPKRIRIDPRIQGGKPIIQATRLPVYLITEVLPSGRSETRSYASTPA